MTHDGRHLSKARLDSFAQYEPGFGPPSLDSNEQRHLVECAECRCLLDSIDPAASFGLLGWLPMAEPLPPLPHLPARLRRRDSRLRLAAGLAAASLVAALALVAIGRPPESGIQLVDAGGERAETWPGIVRRVDSDTATVVSLVPPGSDGPTVTLILDGGFDL